MWINCDKIVKIIVILDLLEKYIYQVYVKMINNPSQFVIYNIITVAKIMTVRSLNLVSWRKLGP